MVNVWAADITPLLIEETFQAYYDKVPEWRKDKADKLKNSGRCCIQSVAFGKVCIVRLQ